METQELYNYLHEYFEYLNGNLHYKKQIHYSKNKGDIAGYIHSSGYWHICIKQKLYKTHRLIFLYHYKYLPKEIDHIDRNKLNNRIENLREATHSQNMLNRKKHKTNKSGYKGVSWYSGNKKWKAQVCVNYKVIHLGYFETPELAYEAYCDYCKNNLNTLFFRA